MVIQQQLQSMQENFNDKFNMQGRNNANMVQPP